MTTYDLTRSLADGSPGYPDDPPVEFHGYGDVETEGYRATELRMTSHSGTHVDAPAHTEPDGDPIDAFDVERFRFDALVVAVDVDAPRQPITRAAVQAGVEAADADGSGADMLVFDTGWAAHWGDDRYHDHPYLTPGAARWVADEGYHVGVDALSVDPTPTADADPAEPSGLPAHHALLGADRFVVENLANLGAVPDRFRLEAYPLPLSGADAAPARVVAEV
jgi:kynurenine formamidase